MYRSRFPPSPSGNPETRQPARDWFSPPGYGMTTFGDLFTDRQLVALNTFSDLVHEARAEIERDALAAGLSDDLTPLRDGGAGAKAYAEAVSVYLGFAIDRVATISGTALFDGTKSEESATYFWAPSYPDALGFAETNLLEMQREPSSNQPFFKMAINGLETTSGIHEPVKLLNLD